MSEQKITITLKFTTVQLVGAALRELPYKLVVEPIAELDMEVQKALKLLETPSNDKETPG